MELDLNTVKQYMIFDCVVGSVAYGLNTAESDVDLRGVFFVPSFVPRNDILLGNDDDAPPKLVKDEKGDTQYYRMDHFMKLSGNVNPSMVELFWMPEEMWRVMTPHMRLLIENRDAFISEVALNSFAGYALQQIKKARGQEKWVNNPQPEEMPNKLDFCKFIDTNEWKGVEGHGHDQFIRYQLEKGVFPSRPVSVDHLNLDMFHASKQEGMENTYRLYLYTWDNPKGVFRGPSQQLVVESIPKEHEWERFYGLMVFNEQEWKKAVKKWKQYWAWMRDRNPARWVTQESGEMDYDCKNIMHCLRILWSGINILEKGFPIIRFDEKRHEMLMDVRRGKYKWDEIMKHVEEADDRLKNATINVPKDVDRNRINDLYRQLTKMEIRHEQR